MYRVFLRQNDRQEIVASCLEEFDCRQVLSVSMLKDKTTTMIAEVKAI